ncbi:uncharacterized protein [Halyomorpha halys]|uniref:uncharacterized protein n=1 Tax=Halyomorpha halys TaxID=286706 RepID=UPI0006D4F858|nr:uncharacterized protein LOC106690791 [Halyomorpha halys]KAE8573151.1 EcKinase 24 [Halyomorpha halys]
MEHVKSVISSLVKNGMFGKFDFVDVQPDETVIGAQFGSSLVFVTLTLTGPEAMSKLPLLIKLPFTDEIEREARNGNAMFYNEVTMYKEILPDLGVGNDFYPQVFNGLATCGAKPDNDLLVLENLKYKNYKLSKTKVFLDFEHISVAIKKIAQFHSFSFIYKHKNMKRFQDIAKKLIEVKLPPASENEFRAFDAAAFERGIRPLIKKNISTNLLETCLSLLKYPSIIQKLSMPEEPFAVICHGDFCNNNVLYKFGENDKPEDCIFLDFQLSQYGSPAMDLFFFLYMHTTSELREKYWDEFLKLYWYNLREYVPNNINIPSFEEFLKHFHKRAIYGYTICALFLPAMITDKPATFEDITTLSLEEKVSCFVSQGGEEGERLISEIVLHLLNRGYIKSFIEFCKENNIES